MRYPIGSDNGKLLSPYHQKKKSYNYISDSLYKSQSSNESLQNANNRLVLENKKLSQSLGAQKKALYNQKFRNRSISQVGNISMKSTIKCTKIIYEFLIGEPPQNWLSASIFVHGIMTFLIFILQHKFSQIKQAPDFGIMVDKSIRGETKNLNEQNQSPIVLMKYLKNILRCNSETISNVVIESIQNEDLDAMKCIVWTTDNMAYMSFNKKVGCRLHIMQIVLNHFEQEAFRIISAEFSQNPHSYNLLYLAWSLPDGYNPSTFFSDKLLGAIDVLPSDEFKQLFNELEHGITKTYEYFEKWIDSWLYLPLIICQFSENHAQLFTN
ncbi:2581_t:CDS:2 [Gigaspora margarita]|uniref:2581_t:CDS:1 n=1 Tax=Gigaspora margarita TaxID=4874 RepID=A0ABM8W1U6_GIGMA|nr:2581_t:CDS:2 [Gigaspora margarita]